MKSILQTVWERLTLPLPEFQEKYAPWTIEYEHDMSKPFTVILNFKTSYQDWPVNVRLENVLEYKLYVPVNSGEYANQQFTQHVFVTTDSVVQYQEADVHKLISIKELRGEHRQKEVESDTPKNA